MENIAWMAWTLPTAIFFVLLAMTLARHDGLAIAYPEAERVGSAGFPTTRRRSVVISYHGRRDPCCCDRLRGTTTMRDASGREGIELSPVARHRDFAGFGRCDFPHRLTREKSRSGQPGLSSWSLQRRKHTMRHLERRRVFEPEPFIDDDKRRRADGSLGCGHAPPMR